MGVEASIPVLADAATSLQSFVSVFVGIYVLLIIVHILLSSWIQLPYSRTAEGVQEFLDEICRPYLRLFQGRIPTLGPLDLSPMVAIVVLIVAMVVVNRLIGVLL
ncbi:MAG: YggT family protein [Actinobacteria bacterium]|nr:MAG: YggT family protein [Actinomycetota bacterium]TML48478.1 MAG: YggT family protein [Actinomycetota bacterium]TML68290.1 MAG: YggT family protein [Actinomycetota bacterium]